MNLAGEMGGRGLESIGGKRVAATARSRGECGDCAYTVWLTVKSTQGSHTSVSCLRRKPFLFGSRIKA